jgi:hypothetical protein
MKCKSKILDEFDISDGVSILVDDDDKHRSVWMNWCCFLIAGLIDNFLSMK